MSWLVDWSRKITGNFSGFEVMHTANNFLDLKTRQNQLLEFHLETSNPNLPLNRNRSALRRPTGRDAPGPSPVHPLRSRPLEVSTSAHSFWPALVAASISQGDPLDNHRDAVLQGDHRQRSHLTAPRRHVHDGEVQQ
jgi:hypothetical protein